MAGGTVPIPFALSSSPGANPQESAGRLINCYAEPLGKDVQSVKSAAPPQITWRKSPGLSLFGASLSGTGFRGSILVDNTLYVAWSGRASLFNTGGAETALTGSLNGSEKVFWARNNKSPPDVVVVAPGTGAFTVSAAAVSNFADADIGAPDSVCFMDGFFIFSYGDGTLQASGLNDVSIATTDKTKAQSKPGGLTRCIPFNGQLYALGPAFGEVYSDTANPNGFPFSRSYVLQRGLLGPYAIAGYEDGFGTALIWVADDNSVVMGNGTPNPLKISPPDLDRLIAGVIDKTTLEASVYIASGHPWWRVTSDTFTWDFDLGSQKWHEGTSYLKARTRAIGGVSAFGKWVTGDTEAGQLLYIDPTNYAEVGNPLVFQIESGPVQNFPHRTRVGRADFNFVTGVGVATGDDPSDTHPTVGISWSDDGGLSWSNELTRELGVQATQTTISLFRTGTTGRQGRRWRLKVSANVYVGFLGATQSMEPRRG